MLYKNYLKKLAGKQPASTVKTRNIPSYSAIKANIEAEFEAGARVVVTNRRIGLVVYAFKVIKVSAGTFVLYRSDDILADGNSLSKTLSVMFENWHLA